jgi:putative transposase
MPRISRAIVIGYPHHVTQRGNYRQTVFAETADYDQYLTLLAQYAPQCDLEIWAYCLMPNHIHMVCVPQQADSLSRTLHTVHMKYARYFNKKKGSIGHLWQGRFFSCALDERHVYAAVRYVEQNPIRAGLVSSPGDYPWSSAKDHISGENNPVLSGCCFLTETVADWRQYLGTGPDSAEDTTIIKATLTGRPCGGEGFIKDVEERLGRKLTPQPRGRPWKIKTETSLPN